MKKVSKKVEKDSQSSTSWRMGPAHHLLHANKDKFIANSNTKLCIKSIVLTSCRLDFSTT